MILITTVGKDHSLLEKFIEYYKRFYFDVWGFLINNEDYDVICKFIQEKNFSYGIFPLIHFKKFKGEFTESKKIQLERILLEEMTDNKNYLKRDWIIYSDLDEFIHIPGGIENRIKLAEMYGSNYIEGLMVDRISEDGTLKEYDSSKPLEEQFPIGCNITKNICGGWNKKIVAAKYHVLVGGGHHVIMNKKEYNGTYDIPYKEEISPWSFGIEIHHFKWNSNIFEKFKYVRNTTDKSLEAWRREYKNCLDFYFGFSGDDTFFDDRHLIEDYWVGNKLEI